MKPAIVVTGASSGIGRELARVVARDAVVMLLIDQSQQALHDLVAELAATGVEAHSLSIDITDQAAGQTIEDALSECGLYCDVLINCAGFGIYGPAAEISRADQIKVFDVNARALAELSLRFLPGMLQRRRGGLLNVGSITGYMAGPYMASYFASKAFVTSFTAALAAEVAGTGVTVTCLAPGVVRTPFLQSSKIGKTRLVKFVPRTNAQYVAAAGWRGFKAGKRVVVPRLIDRIIVGICNFLPERGLLRLIAALQRPRPG